MHDKVSDIIADFASEAPVNIESLARSLGLKVSKNAELPAGISGHLRRVDDRYEIASSKAEHYYRQRFTLAHEIGHYVLHKGLVDMRGGVDDDVKYRSTTRGDIYNSHIELFHEKQANSFAASILMPEKLVREYIEANCAEGLVPLSTLYKHFQVSASAMGWRIRQLDLHDCVDFDS